MEGLPEWMAKPTCIEASQVEELDSVCLAPFLIDKLSAMNITHFFAVQKAVIPRLLSTNGCRDLCVSAPTGSGKTISYVLPIVQRLMGRVVIRLRALVVLPTKDLAIQVAATFSHFIEGTNIRMALLAGQHTFEAEQELFISSESLVDILICTPGRLVDHIKNTPNFTLQHVEFLVIDEADRLLNQAYQNWLPLVLDHLENDWKHAKGVKTFRNTLDISLDFKFSSSWTVSVKKLLFSATLTRNPAKISSLKLNNPEYITVVNTNDSIERFSVPSTLSEKYLVCPVEKKPLFLLCLVKQLKLANSICFTKSLESTEQLYQFLTKIGDMKVAAVSSDKSLGERQKILRQFKKGKVSILICSDGMARGMDLENASSVINYDSSIPLKTYVHRIGRTARAGKTGVAFSIVSSSEAKHFKEMTAKIERREKLGKIRLDSAIVEEYSPKFDEIFSIQ